VSKELSVRNYLEKDTVTGGIFSQKLSRGEKEEADWEEVGNTERDE